jgi:hypothetical protein
VLKIKKAEPNKDDVAENNVYGRETIKLLIKERVKCAKNGKRNRKDQEYKAKLYLL